MKMETIQLSNSTHALLFLLPVSQLASHPSPTNVRFCCIIEWTRRAFGKCRDMDEDCAREEDANVWIIETPDVREGWALGIIECGGGVRCKAEAFCGGNGTRIMSPPTDDTAPGFFLIEIIGFKWHPLARARPWALFVCFDGQARGLTMQQVRPERR